MSTERRSVAIRDGVPALVLLWIPGGRFTMGSANGLPHAPEGPEHLVDVPEFWMADAPVTAEQYEAVMGVNPSQFQSALDLPVESVTWSEAREFCDRLSRSSGVTLRLPSEA